MALKGNGNNGYTRLGWSMIEMHKRQMEFWKSKLGIGDYGVAWIAFLKGLFLGLLIYHFGIAS